MKRVAIVSSIVVAGVVGYMIGSATGPGGRSDTRSAQNTQRQARRLIEIPADEWAATQSMLTRMDTLVSENERLRGELQKLIPDVPADGAPAPGTRLPDGTIVGGARWPESFVRLATGFLDSILVQFLKDADLNADQERRLREEMRMRTPEFTQITADFVNGDIEGDRAYELLEIQAEEARKVVREMLDEEQYKVFQGFERTTKKIMQHQVVHNELASLKSELRLDAAQGEKIEALIEERYRRVGEKTTVILPNILLKPIRAERDAEIYDDTARRIRELLRPDQAAAFDRVEKNGPSVAFQYRPMLIPK